MSVQLTARKTEVLSEVFANLSASWFAIILVSPGIFGLSSFREILKLLTFNIPLGILSLGIAMYLKERSYESKT